MEDNWLEVVFAAMLVFLFSCTSRPQFQNLPETKQAYHTLMELQGALQVGVTPTKFNQLLQRYATDTALVSGESSVRKNLAYAAFAGELQEILSAYSDSSDVWRYNLNREDLHNQRKTRLLALKYGRNDEIPSTSFRDYLWKVALQKTEAVTETYYGHRNLATHPAETIARIKEATLATKTARECMSLWRPLKITHLDSKPFLTGEVLNSCQKNFSHVLVVFEATTGKGENGGMLKGDIGTATSLQTMRFTMPLDSTPSRLNFLWIE
jgi:hypothetical protein